LKEYTLFAGVNGSGKSTLYQARYRNDDARINLDEIVKSLGDWRSSEIQYKAGKIAVQTFEKYLNAGINFNQETTLCGRSILRNIKRAKELGYVVNLLYVGLENVEIAKSRVLYRVSKGGHGIKPEDIERRYSESLKNFKTIIKQCDTVIVYDNTISLQQFAIITNGNLSLLYENVPEWFRNLQIDASVVMPER